MDVSEVLTSLADSGISIVLKVLAAIVFWVLGKWLIKLSIKLLGKAMKRQKVDATMSRYIGSALNVMLTVVLIIAILGFFGVETATFAALIAGAGVAIGLAWSGLLSNFAAGFFMILLRPFKVGDLIQAGGVLGTVEEIGLFVTKVDTLDNVKTVIGNNKIFSDNIQNFSANPYRRVDLVAQLNHDVDHNKAVEILKKRLEAIDGVLDAPAPVVEILEFNLAGPVLAVRPFCKNEDYWDVYFATNKAIREEFGKAGFPVPRQHYRIQTAA